MVAVAVVGIAVGSSVVLWRRAEGFRRLAADHGMHRVRINGGPVGSMWFKLDGDTSSPARDGWRRALAEKYERAARYPRLPVAPDLPEPERGPAMDRPRFEVNIKTMLASVLVVAIVSSMAIHRHYDFAAATAVFGLRWAYNTQAKANRIAKGRERTEEDRQVAARFDVVFAALGLILIVVIEQFSR